MRPIRRASTVCCLSSFAVSVAFAGAVPRGGSWRAWLDSPGGELPFELDLRAAGDSWQAWIVNGDERIAVPRVSLADGRLVLDIDYYDSKIEARVGDAGDRLDGEWIKRGAGGKVTRMAFHATAGSQPRFKKADGLAASEEVREGILARATAPIAPRWSARFSGSEEPMVGVFASTPTGLATGTFLTTTGDYRYLAGDFDGKRLRLSALDGAHAFLFDARVQADGTLAGDFWSRESWHETWTARPDPAASLPDTFHMTRWSGNARLGDLTFPDLDGKPRSLGDAELAGKARIIVIFGSWCPNCHDETAYMVELDRKYRDRGLRVIGLAFELTGEFARDAKQLRTYAERSGITYPVFVAGISDREKASAALPVLDRLRAYPTTIFADASGAIRAVHTGFSGPATGEEYTKLKVEFERLIEEMLGAGVPRP